MMNTKEKILDEALTRFAQKGYANVYVADIAERVGIKAPSLYKHYKSKRAIFDAIIDKMNEQFRRSGQGHQINGTDAAADPKSIRTCPKTNLLKLGREFFLFYLHDDYNKRFRKMLTIEQFNSKELAGIYTKLYVDDPLSYQSMLLGMVAAAGMLHTDNVKIMTLHFYAPIYFLLTMCDRDPEREPEALKTLDEHIIQFNRLYGRTKK